MWPALALGESQTLALFQALPGKERVQLQDARGIHWLRGLLWGLEAACPNLNPNDVSVPGADMNSARHHLCPHGTPHAIKGTRYLTLIPPKPFELFTQYFQTNYGAQSLQRGLTFGLSGRDTLSTHLRMW